MEPALMLPVRSGESRKRGSGRRIAILQMTTAVLINTATVHAQIGAAHSAAAYPSRPLRLIAAYRKFKPTFLPESDGITMPRRGRSHGDAATRFLQSHAHFSSVTLLRYFLSTSGLATLIGCPAM